MSYLPWIVIKFGGTSVSTHKHWQNIIRIVRQHLQSKQRVLIVCSAPSKISNLLDELMNQSITHQNTQIFSEISQHYQTLATALDLNFNQLLKPDFAQLKQWIDDIMASGEATPKIRAKIMAFGELSLTRLGAAYLTANGLNVDWQDARTLLRSREIELPCHHPAHYLAAECATDFDPILTKKLNECPSDVIITQGFIAANHLQESVLLGRGGSDLSASYFAAQLGAVACEIWTDVPGIYTANPHQVPEARLLKTLNYDEAQEIALMGAKVLHPKCIAPVKKNNIPLWVKCTLTPELQGTHILNGVDEDGLYIKSIIAKNGILLISIETVAMWWQVGFLAQVFECFKKHGFSIDLISTSAASVTVSLDPQTDGQSPQMLAALLEDLNSFATASCIGPCATISLVGSHIRAILHRLSPIFTLFEEQQIYLLSQASNDLNLSIVVDEHQAERLLKALHNLLIEQNEYHLDTTTSSVDQLTQGKTRQPWWYEQRTALLALMQHSAEPQYVYSHACLQQAVEKLKACDALDCIYFAMKANNNALILKQFYDSGLGFECVSLNEVMRILELFPLIDHARILFTPNFAPKKEYQAAIKLGITLIIDNVYPLEHWGDLFAQQSVLLRLDPGYGHGHHRYVCTGGSDSKFGIPLTELNKVQELIKYHQISVIGLHIHSGSGMMDTNIWSKNAKILLELRAQFPEVTVINMGGGLGIPEKSNQAELDLKKLNQQMKQLKVTDPDITIWLEPGRFLVATAGVILAHVTQIKNKNGINFIGVDTGMNSLIRPALYGSYHEIVNLTRIDQPHTQIAHIVGPICESGDVLGYARSMPQTQEGDIILIANTGAYGYSMSSNYNLRQPAKECFIDATSV